ncbi:hypothetical protein QFC22_002087 [Naganishia vaughanmartiniae]|uniref:Uncharacterized protein n=1 Tax=Naganishia vaughanmartiniae TaxID=1424756 RepID=A0ACC2XDL1_9TREE|nr:hypothetical protein QFC22_002087 [Naganishia vaughanmartiniae]
MSTAVVPADHVEVAEEKKDVVVVTPDVIEEPKSTTDTKPTNELLNSAPVKETATTPALEHAESAVAPAAIATAPPAIVAAAPATSGDHTDVVKPPVKQHAEMAAIPSATSGSADIPVANVDAPSPASAQPVVPAGNAKTEEVKDVTKDTAKDAKGEKKTSSRSSSSSSGDEANASTATANKTDKPLPTLVTPGTPTVTPATPSKTATPAAHAVNVPAKDAQVTEMDAVAERVERIKLAADAEGLKGAGKEAEKPVVLSKNEDIAVKETHSAPSVNKDVVEASTSATEVEEKKSKPSTATASPKIHRRISARIGHFIDHKFSNEKKKGSAASSGIAGSGVITTGDDKGKDKDSFVSGSAEPHLPTAQHTHANTIDTAPAAVENVGSAPPVLGAPVKVEPMGELVIKDEETVKPAAGLNA